VESPVEAAWVRVDRVRGLAGVAAVRLHWHSPHAAKAYALQAYGPSVAAVQRGGAGASWDGAGSGASAGGDAALFQPAPGRLYGVAVTKAFGSGASGYDMTDADNTARSEALGMCSGVRDRIDTLAGWSQPTRSVQVQPASTAS
jgi:hypothetical protein